MTRLKDLEERIQYLEEWVEEFNEGAEIAFQEFEDAINNGNVDVVFTPAEDLIRDKKRDN